MADTTPAVRAETSMVEEEAVTAMAMAATAATEATEAAEAPHQVAEVVIARCGIRRTRSSTTTLHDMHHVHASTQKHLVINAGTAGCELTGSATRTRWTGSWTNDRFGPKMQRGR